MLHPPPSVDRHTTWKTPKYQSAQAVECLQLKSHLVKQELAEKLESKLQSPTQTLKWKLSGRVSLRIAQSDLRRRNLYSAVEAVYGPTSFGWSPLFSADGNTLISDKEKILERRVEQFKQFMLILLKPRRCFSRTKRTGLDLVAKSYKYSWETLVTLKPKCSVSLFTLNFIKENSRATVQTSRINEW